MSKARMDAIINGKAHGDVATKLLACNMDPSGLRTNDLLRKDEWKQYDTAIVEAVQQRLRVVAALRSRGLVIPLTGGLGTTIYEYEDVSDMDDADVDMDAVTKGDDDRLNYELRGLPLPIVHKSYSLNARMIQAARNNGRNLDTSYASAAGRKVAEKVEDIACNGLDSFQFADKVIYGLVDFPSANAGSLTAPWDASGAAPKTDLLNMKQALIDAGYYGPYMVFAPTAYDTVLDDDYTSNYPKTVRSRLMEMEGILSIDIADKLTDGHVIMLQATKDVAAIVEGLAVTNVRWDSMGGLKTTNKVMTIQVPLLRTDQDGSCGIADFAE
jgi:uncharacterized linocin/CFP29 family protein